MTTAELLKKVRRIEIKTKGLSNHIFAGEYHTAFKGRGMSFSEVREYQVGDDVKNMDWNVTARFKAPFVKVYEEERELTIMLLVDVSKSALFGTQKLLKRELMTELGAVLAFSATTNQDKIGVIFFSDKIEKYIPPKKGKSHVLRIIRELIMTEPQREGTTHVGVALSFLNQVIKKKSISFLLSDFISSPFEKELRIAARKHDLIGLQVTDKMDRELIDMGLLQLVDAENGRNQWVDTADKGVRYQYTKHFDDALSYCSQSFRKAGATLVSLQTHEDYIKKLQTFFKARA